MPIIDVINLSSSGSSSNVTVDGYVQTNPNVNINNFPASQTIAGSISVSNFPASQQVSWAADGYIGINYDGYTVDVNAKGTQGSYALAVQELKDAGRTLFVADGYQVAGVTAEAMITLTPIRGTTAGGSGTSLTITAGKTLRLQTLVLTVRNTTATQNAVVIRLRMNAGSATVSSRSYCSIGCTAGDAAIAGIGSASVVFPDGLEISGSTQFGISQWASGTNCTIEVSLIGYEY